jgi:hypothetical protein
MADQVRQRLFDFDIYARNFLAYPLPWNVGHLTLRQRVTERIARFVVPIAPRLEG